MDGMTITKLEPFIWIDEEKLTPADLADADPDTQRDTARIVYEWIRDANLLHVLRSIRVDDRIWGHTNTVTRDVNICWRHHRLPDKLYTGFHITLPNQTRMPLRELTEYNTETAIRRLKLEVSSR